MPKIGTATKAGIKSTGEAAVGTIAALLLIVILRGFGVTLDLSEEAIIWTSFPLASSFLLASLRSWWNDIMTAFQRGTSQSTDSSK